MTLSPLSSIFFRLTKSPASKNEKKPVASTPPAVEGPVPIVLDSESVRLIQSLVTPDLFDV